MYIIGIGMKMVKRNFVMKTEVLAGGILENQERVIIARIDK